MPRTNRAFWEEKLGSNVKRDALALEGLQARGWEALVVWECETKDAEGLLDRLDSFLAEKEIAETPEGAVDGDKVRRAG